jgi:hypothetical protein
MASEREFDDADDFPTPLPGRRPFPIRTILVVLGVMLLLGLIVIVGPFAWIWNHAAH